MSKCYICEYEISPDNLYKEHIILNSIGGRLKSSSLICNECAPHFDAIDAALGKQLNTIGLVLDIKRDRYKNPYTKAKIVNTGEEVSLISGGKIAPIKPTIDVRYDEDNIYLSVSTRDENQMKEVLKGLKRKHSWIDVQEMMSNAIKRQEFIDSSIKYQLTFGGDEAFRAICKMATSFYIYKGGERNNISHLIPYIRDGQLNNTVWHYHPENITNYNLENIEVLHSLFVVGNPSEKILYAYIELFSTLKFLVLLSDAYTGKEYQEFYSFDVIGQKIRDKVIEISLTRDEVLKVIQLRENNLQQIQNSLRCLFKTINNKQIYESFSKEVENVIENFFKDIPQDTVFTKEMTSELTIECTDKIAALLHDKGFFNQE
ncbi:HNH endonuclease [Nostoc sp.]|uniref:HNH endonuclease n=1 Tax=Nostoc sp. TaxID=1180 RepID=UPI002D78FF22|nr:HNH endonuclease [Nostoc sp.]